MSVVEGDLEKEDDVNIKISWREQNQATAAEAAVRKRNEKINRPQGNWHLTSQIATLSPGFFGPPQGPSSSQKAQNPEQLGAGARTVANRELG